jgi:hypothetical protein
MAYQNRADSNHLAKSTNQTLYKSHQNSELLTDLFAYGNKGTTRTRAESNTRNSSLH